MREGFAYLSCAPNSHQGLEVANMTDMMANMTDLSGPQMMTNTSEGTQIRLWVELVDFISLVETNMSCSEDFYFEESKNYCVPDCYSWTSYSPVQTRAVDAMIIISCCVAILSITAVLIISCIRRKTVYVVLVNANKLITNSMYIE